MTSNRKVEVGPNGNHQPQPAKTQNVPARTSHHAEHQKSPAREARDVTGEGGAQEPTERF